jgi:hypothetical protein
MTKKVIIFVIINLDAHDKLEYEVQFSC